jgi:sugar lactone lactonase YvrE
MKEANGGGGFVKSQGVSVLAGQDQGQNLVVMADSGNNRIVSFKWNGTSLEFSKNTGSLDNPFDLAFDRHGNLWITYPDIKGLDEWPPGSF